MAPPGPDSAQGGAQTSGPCWGLLRAVRTFPGTPAQKVGGQGQGPFFHFSCMWVIPGISPLLQSPGAVGADRPPDTQASRLATPPQPPRQEGPSQASSGTLPEDTSVWPPSPHIHKANTGPHPSRAPPAQSLLLGQA